MIDNNMSRRNQSGFKEKHRTEDNLFGQICQKYVVQKKRAVTDFKIFFLYHSQVIHPIHILLLDPNITGNVYNTIKSMYTACQYCVKNHRTWLIDSHQTVDWDTAVIWVLSLSTFIKMTCPISLEMTQWPNNHWINKHKHHMMGWWHGNNVHYCYWSSTLSGYITRISLNIHHPKTQN